MHYVEQGHGRPVLFVHGNPTSSYLWRNVMPQVAQFGRAIAVDLIGHGRSDKPDIPYTINDHLTYLTGFVEKLRLRDVVIVAHDWGALGLVYASRHPDNVRGLAMMETFWAPLAWEDLSEQNQQFVRTFRDPVTGPELVINQNAFVEQVLPAEVIRTLSSEELDAYRAPWRDPASRRIILQWPRQIPVADAPPEITTPRESLDMFAGLARYLSATDTQAAALRGPRKYHPAVRGARAHGIAA